MSSCYPKNISDTNYTDQCQYVKNFNACIFDFGFLNYFEWQYCLGFDDNAIPTFIMSFWFLVLLLAVATTADSFFAPCLVVVTRILRMSQNLAGVTLLALGNGAADCFSSLAAVISSNDPNVGLALGSILGAGILVNTITAGIIMVICPFEVMRRPIVKDLFFYLIALLWCTIILIRRQIELWSSLVFLSIYIIYVFVTAVSRALFLKYKKHKREDISRENIEVTVTNTMVFDKTERNRSQSLNPPKNLSDTNQVNLGHNNPTYTSDHGGDFLNVPRFNQFNNNNPLGQTRSAETSAADLKRTVSNFSRKRMYDSEKLTGMTSTSHRSMGSFAKIIIKNENDRKIMKINSKVLASKNAIRKTVSLTELNKVTTPKIKIRFYSTGSPPKFRNGDIYDISKKPCLGQKNEKPDRKKISPKHSSKSPSPDQNLHEILQLTNNDESCSVTFPGAFKHFLLTILPVDLEEWVDQSLLKKIFVILTSPITFILTLTIPVVDNGTFLMGWCKILNCLHCVLSPLIWITFIHVNLSPIGTDGFIVTYLILIIGLLASISVAITSKANTPPIYHPFFAFIGFITSIFWVYGIVNEIVNLLTTLGIVLSIPQTILGLSVLAFANSVGDLVSNITLARKNYPRIAYAACVGGPLFNLLVGIGLPFSIKTAQKSIIIKIKSEIIVLIFTILMITVMNLVALSLMKFHVKKAYGLLLIVIYVVFLVLVILFATEVIHISL